MRRRQFCRFFPYQRKNGVNSVPVLDLAPCTGVLDNLPKEMLFKIFENVRLEDLGSLAETNVKLRDMVLEFVESNEFSKKMSELLVESGESSMRCVYRRVGKVLKRATCVLPTLKRLKLAEQLYALNGPTDLVSRRAIAACWGLLIKIFVNGWDYDECERMFKTVCTFGSRDDIGNLLNQFLTSECGTNRVVEHRLRTFYRSVFLDPHSVYGRNQQSDFGFYFDLILREHSTYYQAKLVYLLFGPERDGEVDWQIMCDENVEAATVYNEMGKALSSLVTVSFGPKRGLNKLQLVSLIEELTGYPDNWTLHNFANLVDRCGDSILNMVLTSRIVNGRIREACEIFASLVVIASQRGVDMIRRVRLFTSMLANVKAKGDQIALIFELVKTHRRRLRYVTSGNMAATEFEDELSANELFYAEILRMAFMGSRVVVSNES